MKLANKIFFLIIFFTRSLKSNLPKFIAIAQLKYDKGHDAMSKM